MATSPKPAYTSHVEKLKILPVDPATQGVIPMNLHIYRVFRSGIVGLALTPLTGLAAPPQPYRLIDLGTLGAGPIQVRVLNASGQASGTSQLSNVFLWSDGVLRDLGTLGGFTSVSDINGAGQVTGTAVSSETHAFMSQGETLRDIGTLGGAASAGLDINASGQVTGYSENSDGGLRAFVWDGDSMKDLGTLGGDFSSGEAINGAGYVAGSAATADGETHAFLWNGTVMKDLGTLEGGEGSFAEAINATGQVAGDAGAPSGFSHAFLWDGTAMKDLGTLGGIQSSTAGMNGSGQVTGWSDTPTGATHAFLWDGTMMRDLGSLGGHSFGQAINNVGQVVGESKTIHFALHAFLSNDGQPMLDLNKLIDRADPLKACVTLASAVDINNRGHIAVNGEDNCKRESRAYIAFPMEYRIVFTAPKAGSSWRRGTTVPIKMALVNADGKRISDARAAALVATPCKVKFSASGVQSRSAVCLKYDAASNDFNFDWKPAATGATGSTTLMVEATFKFSMPERITTSKARAVSIIQ